MIIYSRIQQSKIHDRICTTDTPEHERMEKKRAKERRIISDGDYTLMRLLLHKHL